MGTQLCLVISTLLGFGYSSPQNSAIRVPTIDFSTAQEVNNLEPSAIPGIESRSFSSVSNGNYVEATVEEVQGILKTNPDLPRLTRGEIIDLLENITREDMEKLRSLNSNRNGKAVLLVMPYSPKRHGETMEDLYTKRPVTQLIDTENSSTEEKIETRRRKPVSNTRYDKFRRGSVKADLTTSTTSSTENTPLSSTIPPTVSTTLKTSLQPRTRPRRTRPPTTSKPTSSIKPFRRRRITTTTPTTTTRFSNHRYSDETIDKFLPENAMRSTRTSLYRNSRRTSTHKPDLNFAESYTNNVYLKYDRPQVKYHNFNANTPNADNIYPDYHDDALRDSEIKNGNTAFKPVPTQPQNKIDNISIQRDTSLFDQETDENQNKFVKINRDELFEPSLEKIITHGEYTDSQNDKTTLKSSLEENIIPENLKYVIEDLDLESTLKKENVLHDAIRSGIIFPRTTTSTTTDFALTPMPEFKEVADNLSPEMKNLLMTFGLIPSNEEKGRKTGSQSGYYPEKAEDHPESYGVFKPLPEEGEPDKDMDALLASFGLGRSARKGRKIKKEVKKEQLIDFSVVPNSMLNIVENLGLGKIPVNVEENKNNLYSPDENTGRVGRISRSHEINDNEADLEVALVRRINDFSNEIENEKFIPEETSKNDSVVRKENPTNANVVEVNDHDMNLTQSGEVKFLVFAESEMNTTEASPLAEDTQTTKDKLTSVVFNPTDQKIVEHEQEQLDKLMELVKALKAINGSATEEDFENIDLDTLKHFTEVLNNSQRLTIGEQVGMSDEEQKAHSAEIVTMIVPSQAQNEIQSESQVLDELSGGFQVEEEETEPPRPKILSSGPYYLIDWNTFLEVDDTKGRRVNLRFQPTVGDPTSFYSINNN